MPIPPFTKKKHFNSNNNKNQILYEMIIAIAGEVKFPSKLVHLLIALICFDALCQTQITNLFKKHDEIRIFTLDRVIIIAEYRIFFFLFEFCSNDSHFNSCI